MALNFFGDDYFVAMTYIILAILYAIFNAVYLEYNSNKHYNAYVLGIWRGFGIALLTMPFIFLISFDLSISYFMVLVLQGILIGVYDSHVFFASSKYGSKSSSGFMATSVFVTAFMWWGIEYSEFVKLLDNTPKFLNMMLVLMGFTISYWQMMKVHLSKPAERFLYPAVFALALMSIATRYIALKGGEVVHGVVYYLVISCFVSGVYNIVCFFVSQYPNRVELILAPVKGFSFVWLIFFSVILIVSKMLAFRIAPNPIKVMATLLLTPIFSELIYKHKIAFSIEKIFVILFWVLLVVID